ncbi:hypothetical protein C1H46_003248 [Malus baccata]|uniref:Cysteine-rich transmembrane domain-containing protein n=1 Tax=Malus baccata TaxID=106549 RepID=A0A540NJL7_MALBA|nr:hypothetical protein C1H46_003248 [Malus baccata]
MAMANPPLPYSTATSPYYVQAPPPACYPTRGGAASARDALPVETKSEGDGFWKGCCAALCCCCPLDACF